MDYSSMLDTDVPSFASMLSDKKDTYKLWPTEGEMLALIDADLLPYKVGFTVDSMDEFSARRTVELGFASCIQETPQFIDAVNQLNWLINHWVNVAKADSAILYLTDAPNQYRHRVAITEKYKGERDGKDKPPFFYELKRYLITEHNAIVATKNEADDLISIRLNDCNRELEAQGIILGSQTHHDFCDVVAVSIDKDIPITTGLHCNPDTQKIQFVTPLGELTPKYNKSEINHYEYWPTIKGIPTNPSSINAAQEKLIDVFSRGANKGTRKTKRVLIGKKPSTAIDKLYGTGLKFFYSQLITGDEVDCYSGLKGKGAKFAYELLDTAKSEQELFNLVHDAYRDYYGESLLQARDWRGGFHTVGFIELLGEQGNLAWMQSRPNELWSDTKGIPCSWRKRK